MKIHERRLWGMRISTWLVILGLVLGGNSCFTTGSSGTIRAYPAQLGINDAPHLAVWAADADGTRFHSIATSPRYSMRPEDRVVSFDWPSDLSLSLPAKIGSVSILLDPVPTPGLRTRVHDFLVALERENSSLIYSVTVCIEPVGSVANGEDFEAAMKRISGEVVLKQSKESYAPVLEWENPFSFWALAGRFRLVIPDAGSPGQYYVLGPGVEQFQSLNDQQILEDLEEDQFIVFLEPSNLPANHMDAMNKLRRQISEQPRPGKYGQAIGLGWPVRYDQLTSPEAAQLAIEGRLAECTCMAREKP